MDAEKTQGLPLIAKRPYYHAVSLSGGKDSTAMLLLMIEKGMPIDAVFTADTGMEFPEMYRHLDKIDRFLYRERGLHITVLHHPKGFEWLMFDEPKSKLRTLKRRKEQGLPPRGNGWPGITVRWCTGQLKTHLIHKAISQLGNRFTPLHYIGIAADEPRRIRNERYPLVDWGISEREALQFCKSRGFDWEGLYDIYHRCSCWCCPFHPALWTKLRDIDRRAIAQFGKNPLGQFKQNWTVEQLEERFSAEDSQLSFFIQENLRKEAA